MSFKYSRALHIIKFVTKVTENVKWVLRPARPDNSCETLCGKAAGKLGGRRSSRMPTVTWHWELSSRRPVGPRPTSGRGRSQVHDLWTACSINCAYFVFCLLANVQAGHPAYIYYNSLREFSFTSSTAWLWKRGLVPADQHPPPPPTPSSPYRTDLFRAFCAHLLWENIY